MFVFGLRYDEQQNLEVFCAAHVIRELVVSLVSAVTHTVFVFGLRYDEQQNLEVLCAAHVIRELVVSLVSAVTHCCVWTLLLFTGFSRRQRPAGAC